MLLSLVSRAKARASLFSLVTLAALACWGGMLARRSAAASAPASNEQGAAQTQAGASSTAAFTVRVIQLAAKDLVYNPGDGKLYASVPSENLTTRIQNPVTQIVGDAPDAVGVRGNTITEIDPANVTVGRSVWVGSEPADLALADDNRTLYVSLSGSRSIRKFDLSTMTPGLQFWLGPVRARFIGDNNESPPGGGIITENDMRVLAGHPESLLVSRWSGVAIYDDGIERAVTTDGISQSALVVTLDDWPYTAYATDDRGEFFKYGITQGGISTLANYSYLNLLLAPTVDMKFGGGRIYTSNGQIIDPLPPTPRVLGTFPGFWPPPRPTISYVIVDQAHELVYYLYSAYGGDDGSPYTDTVSIRAYDQRSMTLVGSFDIPRVLGRPKGFTRWGNNGLAFCSGNQIYIVRTSLIPSSDTLDLPNPAPTPTPPSTNVAATIRQIQLPNNDIISDRGRGRIYASVPADSPAYANSIAIIDPVAGAVTSSIPAGADPGKLSLTDNGQYLYAGLNGAQAVRRIDLVRQAPDIQFSLVQDSVTTAHDIYTLDMESPPGNPHRVVVSRMYLFPGSSGMSAGPRIYDDGVQWGTFAAGGDTFAFADATTLYGMALFSYGAVPSGKSVIRPDGVTNTLLPDQYFGGDFKIDHGLIFTPIGRIADPRSVKYVGTNTIPGLSSSPQFPVVEPDVSAGRAYYLTGLDSINGSPTTWKLFAFDLSTNLVVAAIEVPGVKGMASPLVRWGDHGLAFGTGGGQIFLIESPAIVADPPASVQFASPSVVVNEGDGRAQITVTRAGDTSVTSTVDARTTDDTRSTRCDDVTSAPGVAFARCDYATTATTLTFAPGETSKSFTVPVINDSFVEPDETVRLSLSNPTGGALGAQSTTTLVIHDNDQPGQPNPIFSTGFFVRQQYLDFLSREPEAGEPWSATLNNCAPNDPACDRISVSANFFRSQEFQLKGLFVFRFYKVAFNRMPLYTEIIPDMSSITGSTTAELIARKAAYTSAFSQRQEFTNLYGAMTHQQFVDALMNRYNLQSVTTINPASPDDTTAARVTLSRADLVGQLTSGALTRGQVVRAIADSNEVGAAEFNPAFVAMQYFGYLRRDPEAGGYQAWLNTINANPADFRSMVNGFMNSTEYRLRFGQP